MKAMRKSLLPFPLALSLSKGRSSLCRHPKKGRGFDKLSPNGFGR
jgi:hypothetical protein